MFKVLTTGDPGNLDLANRKSGTGSHWGCLGPCYAPGGREKRMKNKEVIKKITQHACLCGDGGAHPESPHRLERVLARLAETGLLARSSPCGSSSTSSSLYTSHSQILGKFEYG